MADAPLRHRHYRIMRVSSCGVRDASALLYRDDDGLRCASYATQLQNWLERKIGFGDAFSRAMKSRGHEVAEVIVDLEPVQKTWAWERGLEIDEHDWRTQVLLQQIADFRPEVLFLQGFDCLPAPLRLTIKRRVPSIDLVVIHEGARETTSNVLRELSRADVLFVSSPLLEEVCRRAGLEPQLVYEAFDPSVLCELPAPSRIDDASKLGATFVGSIGDRGDYTRREEVLSRFVEDRLIGVHPALHGLDYFELMQRSRVSLNIHCDRAGGYVGNRRMFEATGVGSCLLTDRGSNLGEIFEDGSEVVTFDGIEDAREKLRYLLDHEEERRAIADAGRARTLRDHTVAKRVIAIDEWIQQALAQHRKATRSQWRGLPGSLAS